MKKIFKSLLFASALVLGLASCEDQKLDFDFPSDVILTDIVYSASNVEGDLTLFTISLAGENGKAAFVFAGEGNKLAAGTYTPAAATDAKKGNYILKRTTVNGVDVESGDIVVTANTIEGNVVCEGKSVHFKWSGTLPAWEQPTAAVALTTVVEAKHNLPDSATVILKLATADGANTLALELYSKDGLLPAGVYTPSAAPAAGAYVIGHDSADAQNLGTCWWTGTTAQKITSGTVYVETADGTNYVITLRSGDLVAVFTGTLALVKYEKPSAGGELPAPSYIGEDKIDETRTTDSYDFHVITLKDPAGNVVASFAETLIEKGAEFLSGEYNVQSYPGAPGLMGNGYYIPANPAWGMTEPMSGGTQVIVDGVTYLVQTGKVTIERAENGRYTFSAAGITTTLTDQATPGITEFSFENVSFGDEPVVEEKEYVELTTLLGFNAGSSTLLSLQFATDGVTAITDAMEGKTLTGEGNALCLDIYTAESGVLAAGTYNACAVGGVVGEGEFGIGYDGVFDMGEWGSFPFSNWGSIWLTSDGAATTTEKLEDGTIKVEVDADTYTITIESSTVNAKYVGPVGPLQ